MTDVAVVGAGLAGLRCAARLEELGREVVVLEASDDIGGRQRTDIIDGYLCDRGFAVINPAYPELRAAVDLASLDLRPFRAGVLVRTADHSDLVALADPRREPNLLAATLRSGLIRPRELAPLARWAAPALSPAATLRSTDDETLSASLDEAGVHGRLREEVLEPFLAGVLVESHGTTSANFARYLTGMFLRGTPGLPSRGIATLPKLIAASLTTPVRTHERVRSLAPNGAGGIRLDSEAGQHQGRAVVIATDGPAARDLLHSNGLNPPLTDMHGLSTWWFATDSAPHPLAMLAIDGRREDGKIPGPVWNCADATAAAPTYAPIGRRLIQATTLHDTDTPAAESDVRRHLAEIYGRDVAGWDLILCHDIPHALPSMPPSTSPNLAPQVGDGIYLCGDHRGNASIQGALETGRQAAEQVHAALS